MSVFPLVILCMHNCSLVNGIAGLKGTKSADTFLTESTWRHNGGRRSPSLSCNPSVSRRCRPLRSACTLSRCCAPASRLASAGWRWSWGRTEPRPGLETRTEPPIKQSCACVVRGFAPICNSPRQSAAVSVDYNRIFLLIHCGARSKKKRQTLR